jgi:hypothetical protein
MTAMLVVLGESLKMVLLSLGRRGRRCGVMWRSSLRWRCSCRWDAMVDVADDGVGVAGVCGWRGVVGGARYLAFAVLTREHGFVRWGVTACGSRFMAWRALLGALPADSAAVDQALVRGLTPGRGGGGTDVAGDAWRGGAGDVAVPVPSAFASVRVAVGACDPRCMGGGVDG